uniref:Secreted protein n=1 Tax=Echinococcus granulosus TaxID=6210 RepID=A0A068WWZ6_ECHGR|nr:hypothetical protein EgrG_000344800 [Echinococcus granulosus]
MSVPQTRWLSRVCGELLRVVFSTNPHSLSDVMWVERKRRLLLSICAETNSLASWLVQCGSSFDWAKCDATTTLSLREQYNPTQAHVEVHHLEVSVAEVVKVNKMLNAHHTHTRESQLKR